MSALLGDVNRCISALMANMFCESSGGAMAVCNWCRSSAMSRMGLVFPGFGSKRDTLRAY